jgi:hypothetical protein
VWPTNCSCVRNLNTKAILVCQQVPILWHKLKKFVIFLHFYHKLINSAHIFQIATTNGTIWSSLVKWASQHKEISENRGNFTNHTIVEAFDDVIPNFEATCDAIIDCIGREKKKSKKQKNGETTGSPDVVEPTEVLDDQPIPDEE